MKYNTTCLQSKHAQKMCLLKEQNYRCGVCGLRLSADDVTYEHLVAKSNNGPTVQSNAIVAHAKCNNILADKPLHDKLILITQMYTQKGSPTYMKIIYKLLHLMDIHKDVKTKLVKMDKQKQYNKNKHIYIGVPAKDKTPTHGHAHKMKKNKKTKKTKQQQTYITLKELNRQYKGWNEFLYYELNFN